MPGEAGEDRLPIMFIASASMVEAMFELGNAFLLGNQAATLTVANDPEDASRAVVGMPDEKWGETVLAVVVPGDGAKASAELQAQLEAWCKERIAGFKRPKAYTFLAEAQMPRTATGKIQKLKLREQFKDHRLPTA